MDSTVNLTKAGPVMTESGKKGEMLDELKKFRLPLRKDHHRNLQKDCGTSLKIFFRNIKYLA